MTHDFAKKAKGNSKKRNTSRSSAPKSQVPGWVWLFTGVVTGLFIAFLAHLADITPASTESSNSNTKKVSKKAKTDDSKKQTTTSFEFYTLLPEREVIVPIEESNSDRPQQQIIYILQAGSFKNAADADRLRAKLILLGLDTKVEAVTGKGNDTWHRVQVGPFISRSKLSKARNLLINNNVETLLLKRKVES
ncbi:SPOR domain-containing protein [Dasania marina]|uniref:SPOR domain-containing protein n=1 Tax=Dasania marina TaxID=471499 RepID=UPI0030D92566|tara:strand:+ start:35891 stop:36466 length:576 start_codon:yes stop_codon:yes gene_type:complete